MSFREKKEQMWPFTSKKSRFSETSEKIIDEVINEFDCHKHQEAYIQCIQQKKSFFSYKNCLELMEIYNFCLASAAFKGKDTKKTQEKTLNPQLFPSNGAAKTP